MNNRNNDSFLGCATILGGMLLLTISALISTLIFGDSKLAGWMSFVIPIFIVASVIFISKLVRKKRENREQRELELRRIAEEEKKEKRRIIEEEEKERRDMERNLAILEEEFIAPALMFIPSFFDFASKEEERINLEYRKLLETKNSIRMLEAYIEYLSRKRKANTALGRVDAEKELSERIDSKTAELKRLNSLSITFESELNNRARADEELCFLYKKMFDKLEGKLTEGIGEYFVGEYNIASIDDAISLIFLPTFILLYDIREERIKVIKYNDIKISKEIFTAFIKEEEKKITDEVKEYTYLHTTKDGFIDLRYKDNPKYYYVYRGAVIISIFDKRVKLSFDNKSLTEQYFETFSEYMALLKKKYTAKINKTLKEGDKIGLTMEKCDIL